MQGKVSFLLHRSACYILDIHTPNELFNGAYPIKQALESSLCSKNKQCKNELYQDYLIFRQYDMVPPFHQCIHEELETVLSRIYTHMHKEHLMMFMMTPICTQ